MIASGRAGINTLIRPGNRHTGFLLVHGLSSNARLWAGVADHLAARGYSSAAVDQRSHGQSDKVNVPFDCAILADDLVQLLMEARSRLRWEEAGHLRSGLESLGVTPRDTPSGTEWTLKTPSTRRPA